MKISIITVCYNAEKYIESCIESVISQDYDQIEYILIDGASTDNTLHIVQQYSSSIDHVITEEDRGIYHAMNKGWKCATGEYIAFLNADDFYPQHNIISEVAAALLATKADCLYGDLVYVDQEEVEKVVRYFPANDFKLHKMKNGLMPPHPTFIAKRELFEQFGGFDESFNICADFELILRFLVVNKASHTYLPKTMVHMRTGGISTQGMGSTLTINKEMLQACKKNGIPTNYVKIYSKYIKKVSQLIIRPKVKDS